MVIERFRDNDMVPVYQQVRDAGRMFPDGLEYVDSCDDLLLLQALVLQWRGIVVTFEIWPVVPSKDTREVVAPHLPPPPA
jgi:hypothetical protein